MHKRASHGYYDEKSKRYFTLCPRYNLRALCPARKTSQSRVLNSSFHIRVLSLCFSFEAYTNIREQHGIRDENLNSRYRYLILICRNDWRNELVGASRNADSSKRNIFLTRCSWPFFDDLQSVQQFTAKCLQRLRLVYSTSFFIHSQRFTHVFKFFFSSALLWLALI